MKIYLIVDLFCGNITENSIKHISKGFTIYDQPFLYRIDLPSSRWVLSEDWID